jgi:3-oxoacyl-[acyl-carrier protein] reductase
VSRVAAVIGGASGIGLAAAAALASRGCRVAIADLAGGEASARTLPGGGHAGYTADIADEAAVAHLFESIEAELGAIAVLVTCAGITGYVDGRRPALREISLDNWNRVFAVNSTGTFLCVREMFRRRSTMSVEDGRIILTGSMAALDGGKNSPAAYVASKGAVHALAKAGMHEAIALKMTINCVAPGIIDTPMYQAAVPQARRAAVSAATPMGRIGEPEEVGSVIAFLASKEAGYICGACIDVNGGMRMT